MHLLTSKLSVLVSAWMLLCLTTVWVFYLCLPLIPAWAQLKPYSWPFSFGCGAPFACEVPVRGLHYAALKKTWFDLTRFYFEGPRLKNSHRQSRPPPRPLLIILDQKGRKNYVDLIFTWLHEAHTELSVLTVCGSQLRKLQTAKVFKRTVVSQVASLSIILIFD